jgi:hypothetical protein
MSLSPSVLPRFRKRYYDILQCKHPLEIALLPTDAQRRSEQPRISLVTQTGHHVSWIDCSTHSQSCESNILYAGTGEEDSRNSIRRVVESKNQQTPAGRESSWATMRHVVRVERLGEIVNVDPGPD